MNCPKCRTEQMQPETHGEVTIDRCPVCKGLFLHEEELEAMVGAGPGVADTFAFSATSDVMDGVRALCPECQVEMVPETGPADVRLDRCPECGAIFLDQGELATLQLQAS